MYDEDIENNGLRELIEKGREQGFITYADINDFLPDDVSDPDQLDEVIQTVNDLGLQVLENAPEDGSDFLANAAQNAQPAITENEMGTNESEVGRTTDPVRLYMREMGSVDLLTREGEITIAKSIEEYDAFQQRLISEIQFTGMSSSISLKEVKNSKQIPV